MPLSSKQQLFIDYYLQYHSARKAAGLAGYPESRGWAIKNTPSVAEEIAKRLAERKITPTEVLDRLSALVRSSLGDVITVTDRGWDIDIPKAVESGAIDTISEIKQKKDGLIEVKKYDTLKALVQAAKLLGMQDGTLDEDERAWYEGIPDEDDDG